MKCLYDVCRLPAEEEFGRHPVIWLILQLKLGGIDTISDGIKVTFYINGCPGLQISEKRSAVNRISINILEPPRNQSGYKQYSHDAVSCPYSSSGFRHWDFVLSRYPIDIR